MAFHYAVHSYERDAQEGRRTKRHAMGDGKYPFVRVARSVIGYRISSDLSTIILLISFREKRCSGLSEQRAGLPMGP